MKEKINSKLLNSIIMCGIMLTIITLIGTPLILTAVLKVTGKSDLFPNIQLILTVCIYACAAPYVMSLFKLKSICKLLTGENCFSTKIADDFNVIAKCAFGEVIIFILVELILWFGFKFFLYAGTLIPIIVIPFIAITAGFIALVMSNIFRKAAEIKEENDLTF